MKVLKLLLCLLWANIGLTQEINYTQRDLPVWAEKMYAAQTLEDTYKVVQLYERYYSENEFHKNQHTQYYKRWLRSLSRQPDALLFASNDQKHIRKNRKDYLERAKHLSQNKTNTANWVGLGPFDFDESATIRSYAPGAAHMYVVKQAPSNENIVYAGAATAGLWKSTNAGLSWSLLTNDLFVNVVLSISISTSDSDLVLFGGIENLFRTSNGGISWQEVDLPDGVHLINDIKWISSNSAVLASNKGLYLSTNEGVAWVKILDASSGLQEFLEIEQHPTNTSIIYAVKRNENQTEFYKSINAGNSFDRITNGWPNPSQEQNAHQRRTEIAVSPALPDYVFALAAGAANGGSGLYGFYLSTDAGNSWDFQCCGEDPGGVPGFTNTNILGYSNIGASDGGQYYYDLALDVSPTAPVEILSGGINVWRSSNLGESWSINAGWIINGNDSRYVHADVHDIHFMGDDLWVATDGGIFYSDNIGNTMQKRMYGIQGTDFKGFGVGHQDASVMIGGTFHNSTLLMNGEVFTNGWVSTVIGGSGGDNTRGFVNPGVKNQVYMDKSGSRGRVVLPDSRSKFYQLFNFEKQPNASYSVGNSCNLAFHPRYYNEILSGTSDQLWKTKDNGASWELVRDFNGGKIVQIEQSIRNPHLLYIVQLFGTQNQNTKLWKSVDAGESWEDVSPSFPSYNYYPFQLRIHSENDQTLYLARLPQYANSSPLDGEKVYLSTNGANSWSNISGTNLNGELLTNLVHQKGSNGFYLGSRRAVYYIDNSLSDWQLYNNNLPVSTFSTKLVPSYSTEKIINATNRGVFESPFNDTSKPIAIPALQQEVIECVLDTAFFSDMSILSSENASWSWSFPGGTPSNSNLKSPKVVYSEAGSYSVTLQVSDNNGSSSTTIESMVTVLPNCSILGVPGKALALQGSGGHMEASPLNKTLTEMTIMAWVRPEGYQPGTVSIAHWQGPGGNATGLYLDQSNQLKFQWAGNHLSFNSGLIANPDEWSHVALVIKGNEAALYLNGRSSQTFAAISNFSFNDPMQTGINATRIGPGYNGLIDELSIWSKSKTKSEVRLQRHLSILDNTTSHLLSYYQFNTNPGYIPDLVGDADGFLISGAGLSDSNGPFGEGVSQEKMINAAGSYNFDLPMVELQIGFGQTPNGSVVISRLNIQPDILPEGSPPYSDAYWIVNNYGSNIDFEALGLIQFNNIGFVSTSEAMTPEMIMLFKRESNDAGVDWGMPVDMADLAIPGALGSVGFLNSITTFSQFVISRNVIVPVELISFSAEKFKSNSALIKWTSSTELSLSHFELERSIDGRRFNKISELKAKAVSVGAEESYDFIDHAPGKSLIYYRLKSVDIDGNFEYSDIRSLDFSKQEISLQLFPNPVRQGQNIQLISPDDQNARFVLFNTSGQVIAEMSLDGNSRFSTETLTRGSYYYLLSSDTQKRSGTIIVQ